MKTIAKIKLCISMCDEHYEWYEVYIQDEYIQMFDYLSFAEDFLAYKGFSGDDIEYEGCSPEEVV